MLSIGSLGATESGRIEERCYDSPGLSKHFLAYFLADVLVTGGKRKRG